MADNEGLSATPVYGRIGNAAYQRDSEAAQMKTVLASLIDRLNLRKWCVEQVMKATWEGQVDPVKAARDLFDFCCEDIEAWLARRETSDGT